MSCEGHLGSHTASVRKRKEDGLGAALWKEEGLNVAPFHQGGKTHLDLENGLPQTTPKTTLLLHKPPVSERHRERETERETEDKSHSETGWGS
ncbi:hypothetical protein AOLI_G00015830 [Acnodon oligacanthus]